MSDTLTPPINSAPVDSAPVDSAPVDLAPVDATSKLHIKKVILYGQLIDNMKIRDTLITPLKIQLCIPDVILRRISKSIKQISEPDLLISPKDKQNKLQDLLETVHIDFTKLRKRSPEQSTSQIEFICIFLNSDIISLIQKIYPPGDFVSYDIIQTVDDAMTKYAEYLEFLSPPISPSISPSVSATSSPNSIPPIFNYQISPIPLSNHCGRVIYLGGDNGANDFDKLSELGITHILNVSECIPNYWESTKQITYMRVPIDDCGSVILKDYFQSVFEFITRALESDGRILVHCFAGKSRSASFVIAYLMQHCRMKYIDALRHVQTHRAVVEPNLGFDLQLREYEKLLNDTNI